MALGIFGAGIINCPSAIAIENYPDVMRGLAEIEIANNAPFIEWIERTFDRFTNFA